MHYYGSAMIWFLQTPTLFQGTNYSIKQCNFITFIRVSTWNVWIRVVCMQTAFRYKSLNVHTQVGMLPFVTLPCTDRRRMVCHLLQIWYMWARGIKEPKELSISKNRVIIAFSQKANSAASMPTDIYTLHSMCRHCHSCRYSTSNILHMNTV